MMNPMQGNPFFQAMQMMRNGTNAETVLEQLSPNNPAAKKAIPFIRGKNPQQMEITFKNLCKERGIYPNAFANQILRSFNMR